MCPRSQDQQPSGLHYEDCCQQVGASGPSPLMMPYLQCLHPVVSCLVQNRHWHPAVSPGKNCKDDGKTVASVIQSCWQLELLCLEARRLKGSYIIREVGKDNGVRFFSLLSNERTRGNGHKLKYRKIHFNIRKIFFTLRVVKHYTNCPKSLYTLHPWRN